jgi:hypothetical protein
MNNVRAFPRPAAVAPQHPPRVFTGDFQERLSLLNRAERELRAMGLQVVYTQLAGPRPQAHIKRDTHVSLGPLMDRMGPRDYVAKDGGVVISGEFQGVIVSWLEPN